MSRLEQLQKMVEREPNDAFIRFAIAMELAKAGRMDESLTAFDRVLEADPNYVAAWFHKGKTLLAMGEEDDAKAALRSGIALAERVGDAHAKGEMEDLLGSI